MTKLIIEDSGIREEDMENTQNVEISPIAFLNSLVRIEARLNDIEKWYKRINVIAICSTVFITLLLLTMSK